MTSHTLRYGVGLSCGLLITGVAIDLIHPVPEAPLLPNQLASLAAQLAHGSSIAMIHLGLLILVSTPLARVIVLSFELFRERQRSFALLSIVVLFLLILSLALGSAE